jgi:hypothetical protein
MITSVDAIRNTVTIDQGGAIPMWKFWLRPDALKLFRKAENVPNVEKLEEAGSESSFLPQKRYADWPIDFDKFNDGVWTLEDTGDLQWPRLYRASDGDSEIMSREDFFTRVPNYVTILNRLKDLAYTSAWQERDPVKAAFYNAVTKTRPMKSTLSKPQQAYIDLMEKYSIMPKKQRATVVDEIVACEYVQSQRIPVISNYPQAELRSKLMEK